MSVRIQAVQSGSIGEELKIRPGHALMRINGSEVNDVLDYRFHMTSENLTLELKDVSGKIYTRTCQKEEYDDLGLEFESWLMDEQHSCRNKCVFCFIDQLPAGMRETLYFKDDDDRMSFLFGNYITLTNLREQDIRRILDMHISPVNISVHTTNPQLRHKMMKNPKAGEVLAYIPQMINAGIKVNTQLVLCPGWNDGVELERTLTDLCAMAPNLQSIAVVPVGLTSHRQGLEQLRLFSEDEASQVISIVESYGAPMLKEHGDRICYPSDEFFLLAGQDIPDNGYYGDYAQLENGIGLMALLKYEFLQALQMEEPTPANREITIVTGVAAAGFIETLARLAMERFDGLSVRVVTVTNHFFGEDITVAGLVCGQDVISQISGLRLGDELLFPAVMLRHERDLFLDDISVEQLATATGCKVRPVENDGFELLNAMLGHV